MVTFADYDDKNYRKMNGASQGTFNSSNAVELTKKL